MVLNYYSKLFFLTVYLFFVISCSSSDSSTNPNLSLLSKQLSENAEGEELAAVLIVTAWVHSSLAPVDTTPPTSPEHALELLVGACGIRDLILQDVLQRLGYQTRRTSFFDVPVQVGHTATEVYVNGHWIFVDPSIGAYFADPLTPDQPLSIAEARAKAPHVLLMQSTLTPWQKKWVDMSEIAKIYRTGSMFAVNTNNELTHPYDPTRIVFYVSETYITSIYTNLDHPEATFIVPVNLDQDSQDQLGKLNGSYADLVGVFFELGGVQFYNAGLWFLGRFQDNAKGIISPTHRFVFSSNQAQTLTVEIHFNYFFGELPSRLIVNGTSVTVSWNQLVAVIQVPVQPPSTSIEISMEEGDPSLVTIDSIIWY